MSGPLSSSPSGSADAWRAAAEGQRLLVALSARDAALFLGAEDLGEWGNLTTHWAKPEELAPEAWPALLRAWRPTVLLTGWSTPPLPQSWIEAADCPLRLVCHTGGSVRQLVPRAFVARGGWVTNWGEAVSGQVAEHALLLALASLRRLPDWQGFFARDPEARHPSELRTRTLFDRRVGLHGFGAVARALVPLLRPFGVHLSAYSAGVPPEVMRQHGVEPCASLVELFAGAEILFECEALTAATRGSVSAAVLDHLPDGAVFVNVGRGAVVDEAALRCRASAGRVHLALDVVAQEPIARDSPYLTLPHTICSPHIAGPTADRYAHCGRIALQHLSAYLRGESLPVVTLEGYDRAT